MTYHFEDATSRIQDLTFRQADMFLAENGRGSLETICNLRKTDGHYSNLALILSDQCPWGFSIHSNHYGLIRRTSGSMLAQLDQVLDTMDSLNNKIRIPGHAGYSRRFPRVAVREVVLNAIIHRDYDMDEDVTIIVGYDQLWFVSPGPVWEEPGNYMDPRRVPRNPGVSSLLESMDMSFRYRYGTRFILESYSRTRLSPMFFSSSTHFLTFLPAILDISTAFEDKSRKIRGFLDTCPGSDARSISAHISHSVQYTGKILNRMIAEEIVFSMGVGTTRRFFLCDRWGSSGARKVPYIDYSTQTVFGSSEDWGHPADPVPWQH